MCSGICAAGQDQDLRQVTVKVVVIRTSEGSVVLDLMTLTLRMMDTSHRGSVTGRGLMGDTVVTAGTGLVGKLAGRVATQCI